ncbi:DUF2341 domain-containing protein [Elusimicrobiota bacterium]
MYNSESKNMKSECKKELELAVNDVSSGSYLLFLGLYRIFRGLFRFVKVPILFFLFLAFPQKATAADWYNSSWQYRLKITISSSTVFENVTDFPVYIDLAGLDGTGFFTHVVSTADIVMTESDGTTKLDREIVSLNTTSNNGEFHFRAPSLSATVPTDFYMYYGNASANEKNSTATWKNNYVAVWHMGETTGDILDSLGKHDSATVYVNVQGTATGKMYGSCDFEEDSSHYIDMTEHNDFDLTTNVTVEVWIKPENLSGWSKIAEKTMTSNSQPYVMYGLASDGTYMTAEIGASGANEERDSTSSISNGVWTYGAMTYDGSDLRVFYNGNNEATNANINDSIDTNNVPFRIGGAGYSGEKYDGIIDEVRVSKTPRTENWINTCYYNQKTSTDFYSAGTEESIIPPAAISNLTALPGDSAEQIELKWTAPGAVGTGGGPCAGYVVRYATKYIGTSEFDELWVSTYTQSWDPVSPGSEEIRTVSGLSEGVTYWFFIQAYNGLNKYSEWTSSGTDPSCNVNNWSLAKSSAPAKINDLSATSNNGNVILSWTATGDNGLIGTATEYDIRYNTVEVTDINWLTSTQITYDNPPKASGQSESFGTPMIQGNTYYFAIKAIDEGDNKSEISNSTSTYIEHAAGWYNENWDYRIKITVSSSTVFENVADFPVYVDLSGLDGTGFFTHVSTDGSDIVITEDNGVTKTDRELVSISTETGSTGGELYFLAPNLSSATVSTNFYMYYGNASANEHNSTNTWKNGYAGVWHLNQTPDNPILDSTEYGNDLCSSPMEAGDQQPAYIGGGLSFDGAEYSSMTYHSNSLQIPGDITISLWINKTSAGTCESFMDYGGYGDGDGSMNHLYEFLIAETSNRLQIEWEYGTGDPGMVMADSDVVNTNGVWVNFTLTRDESDSNRVTFYENGSQVGASGTDSNTSDGGSASYLMLGAGMHGSSPTQYFTGMMDEVRISSIKHTAGWIKTEYYNQDCSTKFFTAGSEKILTPPSPISNLTALTGTMGGEIDLKWTAPESGLSEATYYLVKYATSQIDSVDFNKSWVHTFNHSWTDFVAAGDEESRTVDGLGNSTTYYFAIQAFNGVYYSTWNSSTDSPGINENNYSFTLDESLVAPAPISNLTAMIGDAGDEIKLKWTAPGAAGLVGGPCTGYLVKYATRYIGTSEFDEAWTSTYTQTWNPVSPLSEEIRTVSGLNEGVTYWFCIKAYDAFSNYSKWTSSGTDPSCNVNNWSLAKSSAPDQIGDLNASSDEALITLTWTATGDNGDNGTATEYNIRYNSVEITDLNWNTSTEFIELPSPKAAGQSESLEKQLTPDNTYYFAIKAIDEAGNQSPISNSPFTYLEPTVGWYDSNWEYRIKVTISSSSVFENVNDFPVYLNLSNFADTGFFTHVSTDGADMVITWNDGTTKEDRELVSLSTAAGSEGGEFYFCASTLSATSPTVFYMYYGNASANEQNSTDTWKNSYVAVWHLNETPDNSAGQIKDSTVFGSNGTSVGMEGTEQVPAQIGGGINFVAADQEHITLPSVSFSTDSFTLDMWVNPTSIATNWQRAFVQGPACGGPQEMGIMLVNADDGQLQGMVSQGTGDQACNVACSPANGVWTHVSWTFDGGSSHVMYENGVDNSESYHETAEVTPVGANYIGCRNAGSWWGGKLDEIRIAKVERTENWVKTCYYNQHDSTSFYTSGSETMDADLIAPAAISNLTALTGALAGEIDLKWTAPGDDGTSGTVSNYIVKYATNRIDNLDFYKPWVYTHNHSWSNFVSGGSEESRTVDGLNNNTTYYFAIKAYDGINYSVWNSSEDSPGINENNWKVTQNLDFIKPAAISNLTAITGDLTEQIKLKWTAPGNDGTGGENCAGYLVKYATRYIGTSEFSESWTYTYTQSWVPVNVGSEEIRAVSGLAEGTTYWFCVKAYDGFNNYSEWTSSGTNPNCNTDNWAVPKSSAPDKIEDLNATSIDGGITLTWTATGDNGSTGTATSYDIRYNDVEVTDINWDTSIQITDEPSPKASGQAELFDKQLTPGATYYFAIKAIDEAGNKSAISNSIFTYLDTVEDWYNGDWDYRIKISISSSVVFGTITDFPVYVDLADFAGTGFFTHVSTDGSDIVITEGDGTTKTDRELVSISTGTGSEAGELHFLAPSLSSDTVPTDFYMYYGNVSANEADSTNTWKNGYVGVWHLDEDATDEETSVTHYDALNNNNGTQNQNESTDGIIGQGQDFEGNSSSDYISTNYKHGSNSGSISYWFKFRTIPSAGADSGSLAGHNNLGDDRRFYLGVYDTDTLYLGFGDLYDNTINAPSTLQAGKWYMITMSGVPGSGDSGTAEMYLNGSYVDSNTYNYSGTSAVGFKIGQVNGEDPDLYVWDGANDEVRISAVARSGDWIKTCYYNQKSTSFYTAGGERSDIDLLPPVAISNLTALTGSFVGEIDLKWTAPGDDGSVGVVTDYVVKYATKQIKNADFSASWTYTYNHSWSGFAFGGNEESRTIDGLDNNTTYYFAVKAYDGVNYGVWNSTEDSSGINENNYDTTLGVESVKPAAISNLTALVGDSGDNIELKWTAPGDDGTGGGSCAAYLVKYATKYIATSQFYESWVSTYIQSWDPLNPGLEEIRTISGLTEGVTYWFCVKAYDESYNYSEWTSSGTNPSCNVNNWSLAKSSAPGKIDNLNAASAGPTEGEVTLTWTATGDNGETGTATLYDIRYNSAEITGGNWAASTQLTSEPTPKEGGQSESWDIQLCPGTTYYFAAKAIDEEGNESIISNSPSVCVYQDPSDTTAPSTVANLSALPGSSAGEVDLTWTAPGDDGASGWASEYTLKYATFVIYDYNFSNSGGGNWQYREPIDIYNSNASALTDYNVYIATSEFTATERSHMEGDYKDVRFTQYITGGELNYWKDTEGFYVEVPDLPAQSTTTIYIYYGNISATAVSTTTGVFAFWDDVESGVGGWTPYEYLDNANPQINPFAILDPAPDYDHSPSNVWWVSDGDGAVVEWLTSTEIYISDNSRLSFWHRFEAEADWDGALLQYKIEGDSNWTFAVVGDFEQNATNNQTGAGGDADYVGEDCWSGSNTAMEQVIFNIPSAAIGKNIQFRFVMYCDNGADVGGGWWVDDIKVYQEAGSEPDITSGTEDPGTYSSNWADATDVTNEPSPSVSGSTDSVTVDGLTENKLYYFALKTKDDKNNESIISNSPSAAAEGTPAAISNLTALDGTMGGEIDLKWTAPGADGIYGKVTDYLVKYSTKHISNADFSASWTYTYSHSWSNFVSAGNEETRTVDGLSDDTTYYFAIKAYDGTSYGVWNSTVDSPGINADNYALTLPEDPIGPAAISNLTALIGNTAEKIQLKWTAPGDDGTGGGDCAGYIVKYATRYIGTSEFDASWTSVFTQTWTPAGFGTEDIRTITEFAEGSTYWFCIKVYDEFYNYSEWNSSGTAPAFNNNNWVLVKSSAPENIKDLNAVSTGTTEGRITLNWTATGDNGSEGQAVTYDIRYNDVAINSGNWGTSTQLIGEPSPKVSGQSESWDVQLTKGVTYYFAVKAIDELGNESEVSNSPLVLAYQLPTWYSNSWLYRIQITISSSTVFDAVEDFPVYIDLAGFTGTGFFSNVKTDGSDIIIVDDLNTTKLDRELVSISTDTGSEAGELYFCAPSLSSTTSNDFYMYYGNSGASETDSTDTWKNGYVAVWHLGESAGDAIDSVGTNGNANDGTFQGTLPVSTSAVLGDGQYFDGDNDYVTCGSDPSLAMTGDITVSLWTYPTDISSYNPDVIIKGISNEGYLMDFTNDVSPGNCRFRMNGSRITSDNDLTPNEWNYIVATRLGTGIGCRTIYVDGIESNSDSYNTAIDHSGGGAFTITTNDTYDYKGNMDELRVANVGRTEGWVKTEYYNQKNSTNFFTAGGEEDNTAPANIVNLTALTGSLGGQIDLKWTAPGDDGTTGTVTDYIVKYATKQIRKADFYESWVSTFNHSWGSFVSGGTEETRTVDGLDNETTYYFAIKAFDGRNYSVWNSSEDSPGINENNYDPTLNYDPVKPSAISNLTAMTGSLPEEITLKWTAPGDDGTGGGNCVGYLVKYATKYIGTSQFYESWTSTYIQSWPAGNFGEEESKTLTGLIEGVTYWFSVKGYDESFNYSEWTSSGTDPSCNTDNWALVKSSAPDKINNLNATSAGPTEGEVTLDWTSTGDNGETGTAISYDIRYNDVEIIDVNWASSNQLAGEPSPKEAGQAESWDVQLSPGNTYYFAVKAIDDVGNESSISNSPSIPAYVAPGDIIPPDIVTDLNAVQGNSSGEIDLTWTAPGSNRDDGTASKYTIKYRAAKSSGVFLSNTGGGSWSHNMSIQIYNDTVTLKDYQVFVATADIGATPKSRMQAGYEDVRFWGETGPELDCWVPSSLSGFWIRMPELPSASTTTIYMYYGNASASAVSNYEMVFTKDDYNKKSLKALYNMDEGSGTDVSDISGNNYDGTRVGASWVGSDGGQWDSQNIQFVDGDHLSFSGSGDEVTLPTSNMTSGEKYVTLMLWLDPDTWVADRYIWNEYYNTNYWQNGITCDTWYTRDTDPSCGATGSRNDTDLGVPAVGTGDGWHHMAFVYDGSSNGDKLIYLDGKLSASGNTGGNSDTLTIEREGAAIGRLLDTGTDFDGKIDEVWLYTRILSPEEIKCFYERRKYANPEPGVTCGNEVADTISSDWNSATDVADEPWPSVSGSDESMTVGGLSEDVSHCFAMVAYDGSNNSLISNYSAAVSAPLPVVPSTPVVDGVYASSITAHWDLTNFATGYALVASTMPDRPPVDIWSSSTTVGINSTTATVSGLYPNTTYYLFTCAYVSGASTYSVYNATCTLAKEVTGTQIYNVMATSVTFTWDAMQESPPKSSSASCKGYIIKASSTNFTDGDIYSTSTTKVSISTLTILNLSTETTYWFRIGSLNWNDVANYKVISPTLTLFIQLPPQNTQFTGIYASSATLTWSKDTHISSYILQASTNSSMDPVHQSSSTTNVDDNSLTLSGLHPNTTYYFRTGNLFDPTTKWITTPLSTSTLASKVTGTQLYNVMATSVTFTWNAMQESPPKSSSASCKGYIIKASSTNFTDGDIYSTSTTKVKISTLTIKNLSIVTTYWFKIGTLNWNDVVNYSVLSPTKTLFTPTPPQNTQFAGIYASSATLSWSKDNNIDAYILQASTDSNMDPVHQSSSTANADDNYLTVSGLYPNNTYYFRVGNLFGPTTKWITTPLSTSTLAGEVTGARVYKVFSGSVTIAWDAMLESPPESSSTSCKGYIVKASSTNFTDGSIYSTSTTKIILSTLTVTGLDSKTTYWFRVGSLNWNDVFNYTAAGSTLSANARVNIDITDPQLNSGATVYFQVKVTDIDDDASDISFKYYWNGQYTAGAIQGGGNISTSTLQNCTWYILTDGLNKETTAHIRVYVNDVPLSTSTADTIVFNFDSLGPQQVIPSFPLTESTNISVNTILASSLGVDASTVTDYMFNIDVASDFNTSPDTSTWLTVAQWYPAGLQPLTTYWWRVKARDNWDNECGWSIAVSSFVTGEVTGATNTYDFSASTGVDRWAWYAEVFASTDSSGGTAFTGTEYGEIGINDASRTSHTGTVDTNPMTEMYQFQISETEISSFTVTWRGWTEDGNDDTAPELYIWDFSGTPAWKLLKTGQALGSDQVLSSTTVNNISNYMQNGSCHIKLVGPSVNSNKTAEIYSNYVNIDINETPNTPPEIPSYVDLMPLNPGTTNYLVCTASGTYDADGDTVAYKYNWFRDSVSYGSVQSSGAESSPYGNEDFAITLSSENTSIGEEWYCIVWAEDSEGAISPAGLKTNVINIEYPKPENVTVSTVYTSSIALSWSKEGLADGYTVNVATSSDFITLYTSSGTDNNNDLSLTTVGLTSNTTYYFRVGTTFGAHTEWMSGPLYLSGCTLSQIPTGSSVLNIYKSSAVISWNDVDCIGYKVEASTSTDFITVKSTQTTNGDAQQLAVSDLYTNTTYYFRAGSSNHSDTISYSSNVSSVTYAKEVINVSIYEVCPGSITLNWKAHLQSPPKASSATCSGYIILASSTNFTDGDIYSTSTTKVTLSTLTVISLSEKTTYYFRVGAYNWIDEITYVNAGYAETLPIPVKPSGINIKSINLSSATLAWDANGDADKYILQAAPDSGFSSIHGSSATYNVNLNTLTISGLYTNTTYYFRAGSLFSSTTKWTTVTVSTHTLASRVSGANISGIHVSSITVAWDAHLQSPPKASSATCSGYIVLASSTNFTDGDIYSTSTTKVALSTLTVTGLSENTTYYFKIGAYNWSDVISYITVDFAKTAEESVKPAGFRLISINVSSATLTWDKNIDADEYILQAAPDSGFSSIHGSSATYNVNLNTLTISGLYTNTTYYFRAGNLFSSTTKWTTTQISTSTLASDVNGINISSIFKSSVTIAWDAHLQSPPKASSATCSGYIVRASSTNFTDGDIYSTSTTKVTLSTLTVIGLSQGTTYNFRIGAYNWNDVPNYVSGGSAVTNTGIVPDSTAPEAVTALTALSGTDGTVTLSWISPGDDGWSNNLNTGSKYVIKYSTYDIAWSTENPQIEISATNNSPYVEYSTAVILNQETTYYFRMWTGDEVPNWSAVSNGATVWCRIAPGVVTDLSGSAEDDGSVTLTWTAPGDNNYSGNIESGTYRIGWSTVASVDWSASSGWNDYNNKYSLDIDTYNAVQGKSYSRAITGLRGGTTYYFRIWIRDEDSNVAGSNPNYPGNWSVMSATAGVIITEVISISVSPNTYDFNQIKVNTSTNSLSAVTVINNGNVTELYSIKIASITLADDSPSLWRSTDTTVGLNRFILYSVFNSTSMVLNDFQPNDIVLDSNQNSTAVRYTNDGSGYTGMEVPRKAPRNLWLRIDMPYSVTTSAEEKIRITIEATKDE